MTELSVIICSHNPRTEYLQRTLAALKAQTLPQDQWEFLLVDNASQPPIAQRHDLSWHPQGRHVGEPVLGLTPARFRGVAETRGNWLIFVDDDNVLAPDYLEKVRALAASHPRLAVFGSGMLQPEFEIPPPAELKDLLPMLALRELAAPRWSNDPGDYAAVPCGAGLCVRRETAAQCAALVEQLKACVVLDRKGGELFSHGDDLFSWAAARAGMEFGVFPELRITHLIGAGRLNQAYFLRLIYYHACSHGILRYLLAGEMPRRAGWMRQLRVIPHTLRRGVFSGRCQLGWLKGEDRAARMVAEHHLQPLSGPPAKKQKLSASEP